MIGCYYNFGEGIKLWFDHYRKTCNEDTSNSLVNDKIRKQIHLIFEKERKGLKSSIAKAVRK